jgi:multidrug efflux pump subunit AcrB
MSKFFIRRPIVAMVISIVMVIVGVVSMVSLPTAQFPNIVPPEILVQATYPGADAKTLEQSVATPIEQQMSGVDNMDYMWSTNASNGQTQLNVDFNVTTDQHRSSAIAVAGLASAVSAPQRGEHGRHYRTEIAARTDDADCGLFAAWNL